MHHTCCLPLEPVEAVVELRTVTGRRGVDRRRTGSALLAVLYGVGLRRSEVFALDLADYSVEAGELHVHGKGNRDRVMPITDGTTDPMAALVPRRAE